MHFSCTPKQPIFWRLGVFYFPCRKNDERKKTITLEEITEGEIIRAVTLTYETGMILSAFAETADGEPLAQCRSMFYTMNPEFSADDFLVPMT